MKNLILHVYRSTSPFLIFPVLIFILLTPFPLFANDHAKFKFNHQSSYWPTISWRYSSPELQGMDSAKLLEMFESIKQKPLFTKLKHKISALYLNDNERDSLIINGIVISRNGFIVSEATSSYHIEAKRPIYSSTKSILSGLFGIGLDLGYFKNLDEKVIRFFPEYSKINQSKLFSRISLKHLLTMSCGFEWPELQIPYSSPDNPVHQMMYSDNWVKFAISRNVKEEPGTLFNYNSGCSQILATILHNKTTDGLEEFAKIHLFDPLGIDNWRWETDTTGIVNGSHGLNLELRDMAKIGYLFLKGGYWDGKQIISKKWIEESTQNHIDIPGTMGRQIKSYGYKWYIHDFGFHSLGYGGQYIFVVPEHELVVVFTSTLARHEIFEPINLIKNFIIPSIKSSNAIPENPIAFESLRNIIESY